MLPPGMTGSAIVPLVVRLMRGDRTPVVRRLSRPGRRRSAAAPGHASDAASAAAPADVARAPRPLAGVPSLLPAPPPPSAVEPPKRYATAAAANGPSTWKTTPVTASAASGAAPSPDLAGRPERDVPGIAGSHGAGRAHPGDRCRRQERPPDPGARPRQRADRVRRRPSRPCRVSQCRRRGGFSALITAAHGDGGGRFCFVPAAGGTPARPRTIDKSVDQLLLSTATAIDEKG